MKYRILITASTRIHIMNFHLPYIREFKERGWDVEVACGDCSGDIPEADRTINIPFKKEMFSPKNIHALMILRKTIHRSNYDLVICHTSLAAFFTRLAVCSLKKRPLVVNVVHGYLFDDDAPIVRRLLLESAEKLMAPVTDAIITMNSWDAAYAKQHRLGKSVMELPGIGVDFSAMPEKTAPQRQELRQKLGLGENDFVLIYAAEFSKRKSQQILIEAMTLLPDNVVLVLPGCGALRDDCISMAQRLGLEKRVFFPGYVSDMPQWYMAADAAVSSSRSEGLPFNIMEAMYYFLPVVASNVKGNADLITDGKTGLLYPYGDSGNCARQILRLIHNPEFAKKLSLAANIEVKKYDIKSVLPHFIAILSDLLKNR